MNKQILYPDPRYKSKLVVEVVLMMILVALWWTVPAMYFAGNELDGPALGVVLSVAVNLILLVAPLLFVGPYYRSLRYEILDDEVIVVAGILTKSVKHVPYRTVTNLKVTRGPIDRLFGLGSLAIQTAGMSGTTGAEENLVGLSDVQEVYEEVAARLRRYRSAMAADQASEGAESLPAPAMDGVLLSEILDELRAIRGHITRQ
ncbi:MAG: PH domain-containing protein [Chloroflexi bacterium]|nr:PH domain-containing protein [Chloroflexota bacterium]